MADRTILELTQMNAAEILDGTLFIVHDQDEAVIADKEKRYKYSSLVSDLKVSLNTTNLTTHEIPRIRSGNDFGPTDIFTNGNTGATLGVGIGTASPTAKLHILKNAQAGFDEAQDLEQGFIIESIKPSITLWGDDDTSGTTGAHINFRAENKIYSLNHNLNSNNLELFYGEANANAWDLPANTNIDNQLKLLEVDSAGEVISNTGGIMPTQFIKKNITTAQILALNTTPIAIVAAPGVNKMVIIDTILYEYTFLTGAYAGTPGAVTFQYGDPSLAGITSFSEAHITAAQDTVNLTTSAVSLTTSGFGTLDNEAVYVTTATNDPTTGAGDIDISVWYHIYDTSL